MLSPNSHIRGFTLVELAITILIIGILFAMGIPAIGSMSQTQLLRATTENMAAQIRMARQKAISSGQQQTFHFFENTYDADYHIHNGSYVGGKWAFPQGITYYWGAGTVSVYDLKPDGTVSTSGLLILQNMRGAMDTVSVQVSGLVLTR